MKINRQTNYKTFVLFFIIILLFFNNNTYAGHQKYSELKEETALLLSQSVSDTQPSFSSFKNQEDEEVWINRYKRKIEKNFIDEDETVIFLKTLHYEATRAGLDPKLILSLVQVESNFTKYAISSVGARGYMQVMPFWVETIGKEEHNLFHLRTNLRYGCTILRHYLELEKGNLFMALGRYNGTRGQSKYPNAVLNAKKNF